MRWLVAGLRLILPPLVGWVRLVACALLVLAEPIVRALLLGGAFAGFAVSVLFGWVLHARGFPVVGMTALSVGLLLAYWSYVGMLMLLMRGPRG